MLITGPRGAGKTTLCTRFAAAAREAGWDVAGLLSPARLADGRKAGIDVRDLRSGEQRPLAERRGDMDGTDGWAFHADALAWGEARLRQATPCDVLIVDELGPLELVHGEGWQGALAALERRAFRLALVVIRPELLEAARARWPDAQVIALRESPVDELVARLFSTLDIADDKRSRGSRPRSDREVRERERLSEDSGDDRG